MNLKSYCKRFSMICYSKSRDKIKKFYENQRTFSLRNPKDKCFGFVKGESTAETACQKRCDYIICFDFGPNDNQPKDPTNYLFVELKGSDNDAAFEQIISTIKYFLQKGNMRGKHVDCFIVSGSCPSVDSQKQIYMAKFPYRKSPYDYTLRFKSKFDEYEIK